MFRSSFLFCAIYHAYERIVADPLRLRCPTVHVRTFNARRHYKSDGYTCTWCTCRPTTSVLNRNRRKIARQATQV